jgi:hypothetical protein
MRRYITAAVALTLVAAAAVAGASVDASPSTADGAPGTLAARVPAPAIDVSQARQIALTRAAGAGDTHPSVSIADQTLGAAEASMHAPAQAALAEPETPVYLVTLRGHFVLNLAHVPRGLPAPAGNAMQLTIDHSGRVLGLHVGSEP